MIGNPHGADHPEDDFADDGANTSDADGVNDGGMDDGASGMSEGSGGAARDPRHGHTSGGTRTLASPLSTVALNRGGASGRSRRAAVADAAVEAVMAGGGDLMRRLAESLSDGARHCDEKKKTKRLAAVESERTKRVALLTAAVEKHPENETFRDMLKVAMGEPAGPSSSPL